MFVDTNVLIAARFSGDPNHNIARACLAKAGQSGEPLRLSLQVLREYISVATRSQTWLKPLSMDAVLEDIYRLLSYFEVLEENRAVLATLLALCKSKPSLERNVHDTNIVATLLAHGETRLLTINLKDFRRFAGEVELITPTGLL